MLIAFFLVSLGCKREGDRIEKLAAEVRANPSKRAPLEELKKHTTDSDFWNRYDAFNFLGELAKENVGNYRGELLPYFNQMLTNSDGYIRRMGIEKLLDMPLEISEFLPTLVGIVQQGKEDDVTWFSTEALGKLQDSKLANEVFPVLLKAVKKLPPEGTPDGAPQLRYCALDSIEELAQKKQIDAIPELQKVLEISKPPLREHVAQTISEIEESLRQK